MMVLPMCRCRNAVWYARLPPHRLAAGEVVASLKRGRRGVCLLQTTRAASCCCSQALVVPQGTIAIMMDEACCRWEEVSAAEKTRQHRLTTAARPRAQRQDKRHKHQCRLTKISLTPSLPRRRQHRRKAKCEAEVRLLHLRSLRNSCTSP